MLIGIVAVFVFGPDKLPDLARQAGADPAHPRLMDNARNDLPEELGEEFPDLSLRDLDPRTIVRKHIIEAMEDGRRGRSPQRRNGRPLARASVPPYDLEAT